MQVCATPQIARPPLASESAAPESTTGDRFATLLSQQQPAPADEIAAEQPTDAANPPDRGARTRSPNRPTARSQPRDAQAAQGNEAAAREAASPETRAAEEGTDAADPALHDWLAALHLPAPATAAPAGLPATDAAATDTNDSSLIPDTSSLVAGAGAPGGSGTTQAGGTARTAARDKGDAPLPRAPGAAAALRGDAAASASTDAAQPPAGSTRFAEALAGARSTAAETLAAPLAAPALAPQAASTAPTGTPQPVPLTTPTDDPQFPRAFGVQVSMLARDGVQQAELQLNPAEMGPVSVQIVMEGTQARIDFGADAAATRDLIEHSLPELAAALREAGLTLSGGGVSQHSQGRQQAPQAGSDLPGEHHADASTGLTAATQPTRRHVRAGGIDLYA